MSRHALLLSTAPRRLHPSILDHQEIRRLDVITEPGYVHQYPASTGIHLVDSVRDVEAVSRAALAIHRADPLDGVIAPFEYTLPAAARVRSMLGLSGPDARIVQAFYDKAAMKAKLSAAGLPVAPHRVVSCLADVPDAAAELGWPLIVKPAVGTGSMGVARLADGDECRRFAESSAGEELDRGAGELIVEAWIDMTAEYHCDGLVRDGVPVFAAPSRYLIPRLDNTASFSGSATLRAGDPTFDAVSELHARAVKALELDSGVTHMELYHTETGFMIGEITCRPGGAGIPGMVARRYGVDLWRACTELSISLELSAVASPPPDGVTAYCDLPIRKGKIVSLSTAEELSVLPGVVGVEMKHQVGDVITGRLFSASTTGLVYLEAEDETELSTHLVAVARAFRLRMLDESAATTGRKPQ